ncbi:MAG: thiamine biosynthesis protein ApbE [Gammaproteobacteria bacterium HGW-Gammaproteobacteria-6]|nr:MAG: thiamine biosynthesis protein ApbE [Gammaproteobacteria bacterium HGW-Gammaproteobacteria-6]
MLSGVIRPVIAVALAAALAGCFNSADPIVEVTGLTMGSSYSVKWVASDDAPDQASLHAQLNGLFAEFETEVSTWRDDSVLSRFNQLPSGGCISAPDSLRHMLETADRLHELSGGSFDLTVGPLLRLWGFHGGDGSQVVPDESERAAALQRVGQQHLRHEGEQLCKDADVSVDVSAIAAGYMVDRIAEHLLRHGITSYMVEVTGELKAAGRKPDGSAWRIAIEEPRDHSRIAHLIINLDGYGVSTSGDYRNYFEYQGKRYSHTFDPVSGQPVMHQLASVTVLDRSTEMADGLSTVLLVKGPEAGWAFAIEQGIAALFVLREGEGFVSRFTPAFEALKRGEE